MQEKKGKYNRTWNYNKATMKKNGKKMKYYLENRKLKKNRKV
jgi:hypothetical protein